MKNGNKFYRMVKILLFLFIGNALTAFGQSGLEMSVSGLVKDFDSNAPIPGIEVIIFKVENDIITDVYNGTSDRNGFYKVRYLAAGKYKFSVDIPGLGMVLIGMIAVDGGTVNDLYEFEVIEGINTILNFFLAENPYPHIERDDDKINNEINFTMLYVNPDSQNYIEKKSLLKLKETTCGSLKITDPAEIIVKDTDKIIIDGKEANASFCFQLKWSYDLKCVKNKCVYLNLYGLWITEIKMHSLKWYYDRYPYRSKELNACYRECSKKHEEYHNIMFGPIACEEWEKFLNSIDDSVCCCTEDDTLKCKNCIRKKIFEMRIIVANRIDKTEIKANSITYECQKKCLELNNKE